MTSAVHDRATASGPMDGVAPAVAYALMVRVVALDPKQLRPLLSSKTTHNICMIAFSACVCARTAYEMWIDDRFESVERFVCQSYVPESPLWTVWYWSKMWEWFDTLLIVAASRPVSSLHYYHHMTTPLIVACQSWRRDGLSHTPLGDVGMLLNSGVHTAMYAYYLSPKTLAPYKKAITTAQVVQHGVMLLCLGIAVFQKDCDATWIALSISILLYAFYFSEFVSLLTRHGSHVAKAF